MYILIWKLSDRYLVSAGKGKWGTVLFSYATDTSARRGNLNEYHKQKEQIFVLLELSVDYNIIISLYLICNINYKM